jgi:hypothetical protein
MFLAKNSTISLQNQRLALITKMDQSAADDDYGSGMFVQQRTKKKGSEATG